MHTGRARCHEVQSSRVEYMANKFPRWQWNRLLVEETGEREQRRWAESLFKRRSEETERERERGSRESQDELTDKVTKFA